MAVRIIVDSACDLIPEQIEKYQLDVLPIKTIFGEEEFLDGVNKLADDPVLRASAGHRSEEIAASFDKKAFGETIAEIYQSARINCENMQH